MHVEIVNVARAGELLGCGRTRVFELIADGTLERAPKFGRAIQIYRASVDRALLNGPKRSGRRVRAPAYVAQPVDRAALKQYLEP